MHNPFASRLSQRQCQTAVINHYTRIFGGFNRNLRAEARPQPHASSEIELEALGALLWTARTIAYRHENAIAHEAVAMAVVVQTMVPAEVSGILFTVNPVSGDRDEMIVNSGFGLGEAIVGGEITPDGWWFDEEKARR